jgi:hypothetical protein
LASSLIIDGNSYTLVDDIKTLAADIAANPSGFYAFANDYDASIDGTYTDSPVATTLQGTFDGLGHTISNLTVTTNGVVNTGFFAQIGPTGAVRNIVLKHVQVSIGTSPNLAQIGSLAAENDGLIESASITGSIFGGQSNTFMAGGLVGLNAGSIVRTSTRVRLNTPATYAGGIAGWLNSTAQIVQSFATGDIVARNDSGSDVGGLAGYNYFGSILLSHATGKVTASGVSAVGGLIGINRGTIDQSFATGPLRSGASVGRRCYGSAGGLAGANYLNITNSYAIGSAKGDANACVGGLAGYDISFSSNSYAVGHVRSDGALVGGFAGKFLKGGDATASHCYWDTETSGTSDASGNQPNVPGVLGLTTLELQAGLPEGFDPRLWGSNPNINNGYPYLLANPPQ